MSIFNFRAFITQVSVNLCRNSKLQSRTIALLALIQRHLFLFPQNYQVGIIELCAVGDLERAGFRSAAFNEEWVGRCVESTLSLPTATLVLSIRSGCLCRPSEPDYEDWIIPWSRGDKICFQICLLGSVFQLIFFIIAFLADSSKLVVRIRNKYKCLLQNIILGKPSTKILCCPP